MSRNPFAHPMQAAQHALGVGPSALKPSSTLSNANEGPAEMISKGTGVVHGGPPYPAPCFTSNEGIPVPSGTHSKNIGGIPVVSDFFLMQKQQTFNRAKTLERMVHPAGSGAFGYFECTNEMSQYTKACLYGHAAKRTPIFLRFSTVTFGREFADSGRNPRGFAIKHYTEDGNYDMVGLNWPIFFCRDPMQGPDVIRSQQRNPQNFLLDYNATFDFLANTPESNHAGMMFFSDYGTPQGWRGSHGYGCHTFKWVNKHGQFYYVKYHYINAEGQKQFTWPEAVQMSGEDPDFSKRDLFATIERGETPTWVMKVQIMASEEADPAKLGFDPFDVTKVWPRSRFPMREVGRVVLNKNPENYHRDVEQAAFSPGAMIPGIEDSPDSLLQFRMFFYRDAQYHRLGVNLHQVPVNCPFMANSYCPLNFDGALRSDANTGGNPDYVPNSFVDKFRQDTAEQPYLVGSNIVSRQSHFWHEGKDSDYDQARDLYNKVMDDTARDHLHKNTAGVLKLVDHEVIKVSYLARQYIISPAYARGIYDPLPSPGFAFSEVEAKARSMGAPSTAKEAKFAPTQKYHRSVGMPAGNLAYN